MKNSQTTSKNKSVLFLLTQDLESPSGLGRYFPISKYLAKQGFSVNIAALHSNYASLNTRTMVKEGVKVHYVAQMHIKKENNRTTYFNPLQLFWHVIKATWRLFLFVLKNPADTIVIGKPHPMNSIAGILGGYLKNSKIVLDCDDYEAASNYFSSKWQQRIVRFFEDKTPRFVHKITTNTFFNKERMIALGVPPEKIHYLPNGVDPDRFKNIDKNKVDEIVDRLNLSGKQIIAYIGSLNLSNHPVDLLIDAFKLVSEANENAALIIVGAGKDLEKLKDLSIDLGIKDKVFFEGRVDPEMVANYYELADVTVDPVYDTDSAKGRCPLKMFESWLTGTPFVTSNVGDRKLLSGDLPTAMLTLPGDASDLAIKIRNIIDNQNLTLELRQNSLKTVGQFYWKSLVKEKFIPLISN
ncbi:MAG: glycosyltransferase family 4 protein [Brevefilum sp.]|nr:glycosyltransferase family 4 protein [Brevefilum sp.]